MVGIAYGAHPPRAILGLRCFERRMGNEMGLVLVTSRAQHTWLLANAKYYPLQALL